MPDMEKEAAFYRDVMGMKTDWSGGADARLPADYDGTPEPVRRALPPRSCF